MSFEEGTDTVLHEAVRYGDLHEVRSALQTGCCPNSIGMYQWSPLHEASHNGDLDIVELLLRYNGNPDVPDRLKGFTAVHYAAGEGHDDVLRVLLAAGGSPWAEDREGHRPLDVATGDCVHRLRNIRDRVYQAKGLKNHIRDSVLEETLPAILRPETTQANKQRKDSERDSLLEPDELSIHSGTSSNGRETAWGQIDMDKSKELGSMQISLEYNAKASSLKIRIWQISDLLMPPVETSAIGTLYVKSYLLPDEKKTTKRKTEEVKAYSSSETQRQGDKDLKVKGASHPIRASSYKFQRPLEYSVTSQQVRDLTLQLEVIVTHRYSRRSYAIGTWTCALKHAVRRVVKTTVPLVVCSGSHLPANMAVYCARAVLPRTRSTPVSRQASLATPYDEPRAGSDPYLREVAVRDVTPQNVVIDLSEPESADRDSGLRSVAVQEDTLSGVSSVDLASVDLNDPDIDLPGSLSSPGSDRSGDFDDIRVSAFREIIVHTPEKERSVELNLSQTFTEGAKPTKHKYKKDNKLPKKSSRREKNDVITVESPRPDTPSWDHYNEPLSFEMVPLDFENDVADIRSGQSVLHMETTLHVKSGNAKEIVKVENESENRHNSKQISDKRRGKAKYET